MATRDEFVHLHLHSDYSLLDGACRIDDIVAAAKRNEMRAVALTDHGNLFGAIEFYRACTTGGIRPILGMEAYIAPGHRKERKRHGSRDAGRHLTLLVENNQGYRNLLKLSTLSYREGFYYKPRMDKELLAAHHEGLIALSGCLNSEFSHCLRQGRDDEARHVLGEYADIFGPDRYYVEIQSHGLADQNAVTELATRLAAEHSLPLVATNDVHYIDKADATAHDCLLCISTNHRVTDAHRLRYPPTEFYFKSHEEIDHVFRSYPEAVRNTGVIASRCFLDLEMGRQRLPRFESPNALSNEDHLRNLARQGVRGRYGEVTETIRNRLEFELDTIVNMGFASYFLIVADFLDYARKCNIPVGPGRGSAAGSIVAYALNITEVDPLRYDLLFERFLNPARREMPDIDIDFCPEGRPKVLDYVRNRYGKDHVAQIITFGTMAARGVLRDVGRVMGVPLAETDAIAKKVPMEARMTLARALEMEPELAKLRDASPEKKHYFDICKRLEGLHRHASIHAAGVVISDVPLTDVVPLYSSEGIETTQYSMDSVTHLGLLKMDFLGLTTLTQVRKALDILASTRNLHLDPTRFPLDDGPTFSLLQKAETTGIFQLESSGMRDLLQKMKPDRFDDIIALLALFRPGPLGSGMVESFIRCKHGLEEPKYLHDILRPILGETHGVMLYQEQVMRVANLVGGLPLAEADNLRKAMGKKKPELLARYQTQFIAGAQENGVDKETAQRIFELMEYFSGYGFNKSHSTAYALISYQTAYLKANYPVEYMCALLTCESANTDKLVVAVEECRRLNVEILPPDVNRSETGFSVEDGKIRYGLGAVKNVGEKAIEEIRKARAQVDRFEDIYHFCERVHLQAVDRRVMENLIKAGALDTLGGHRAQLLEGLDGVYRVATQAQKDKKSGQMTFFDLDTDAFSEQRRPPLPSVAPWSPDETLACEKESLGFYFTENPLERHRPDLEALATATTEILPKLADGAEVLLGGMVVAARSAQIRTGPSAGQKMKVIRFRDLTGTCDAILLPELMERHGLHLVEDAMLFVRGKLSFRREEPSVRIQEVIPLGHAREELTQRITITLYLTGLVETRITTLRDVLLQHPGRTKVHLRIQDKDRGEVEIRTSNDFCVTPSERLFREIRRLLGEGRVQIHGAPKVAPAPKIDVL